MRIWQRAGKAGGSAASAAYVILTNGVNVALLSAAETVRAATNIVLSTQHLDETGAPLKSLASILQAGFVRLTNGTLEALLSAADAVRNTDDIVLSTQNLGADGNPTPSGYNAAAAITQVLLGQLLSTTGPGIYRSGIHFTAVQNAATEIDLAGGFPTIDEMGQFIGVAQISTAGAVTIFYPQTHAMSWDAVNDRLTITGGAFDPTDTFVVVIAGADRYANDPSNYGLSARVNSDRLASDDAGIELLGTPLVLTVAYQDVGARIPCFGYTMLELGLTIDINLSTGLELQALVCYSQAGVEEYSPVIETPYSTVVKFHPANWEDDTDADKLISVPFKLSGAVPFVQIQARVQVVGGTAAEIDYAEIVRGWGGA